MTILDKWDYAFRATTISFHCTGMHLPSPAYRPEGGAIAQVHAVCSNERTLSGRRTNIKVQTLLQQSGGRLPVSHRNSRCISSVQYSVTTRPQ